MRAIQVISSYATELAFPLAQVLLRLDGLYGDAAPLIDVLSAGLGVIARRRDYTLLDLEIVKQVLYSDRWCSHTPNGQEFWQILCQWVWNLRLELGQKLSSSALRTTEFAKASVVAAATAIEPASSERQTPQVQYGSPQWARPSLPIATGFVSFFDAV